MPSCVGAACPSVRSPSGPSPPADRKPRPSRPGLSCRARLSAGNAEQSCPHAGPMCNLARQRRPTTVGKSSRHADYGGRHDSQQRGSDDAQTQVPNPRHVHALQRLPLDGSAEATLDWRHATVKYLYTDHPRQRPGYRHLGIPHSGAAHAGRAHANGAGFADDSLVRLGDRARACPSVSPRPAADRGAPGRASGQTPRPAGVDVARHIYFGS